MVYNYLNVNVIKKNIYKLYDGYSVINLYDQLDIYISN